MKARNNHRAGLWAERIAALILRVKGYAILERRFKTPVGEIDLIVRRGRMIAFIEVKTRPDMANALGSVTPQMRTRIIRAAQYYLAQNHEIAGYDMRFDVFAFVPPFFYRHLDNAWQADS